MPPLVQAAAADAQFETIHPFLDGNGRVGRLLITLLLCSRGVLDQPLLYLSLFLRQNRSEYYDRLSRSAIVVTGRGGSAFSSKAHGLQPMTWCVVAGSITTLRHEHLRLIAVERFGRFGVPLLDLLASQPLVSVKYVEQLGSTPSTVGGLLDRAAALDIVEEITGQRRNRLYRYTPYLDLFESHEANV